MSDRQARTVWRPMLVAVGLLVNAMQSKAVSSEEIKVSKVDEKSNQLSMASEGAELIGTPAPEFKNLHWMKGCQPLTIQKLQGQVVLIRFWLGDCELCSGSAPALNRLYSKYHDRGLTVIGVHHPKSAEAKKEEFVARNVHKLGFQFPIAIDNSWSTIDQYWLGNRKRSFTSASFLVDRHGLIRWIHPGGVLAMDENPGSAFSKLETLIVKLLEEK
jgi:peroxiredoxin